MVDPIHVILYTVGVLMVSIVTAWVVTKLFCDQTED